MRDTLSSKQGGSGTGTDTTAVHTDVADEFSTVTAETTPASGDLVFSERASDGAKRKIALENLDGDRSTFTSTSGVVDLDFTCRVGTIALTENITSATLSTPAGSRRTLFLFTQAATPYTIAANAWPAAVTWLNAEGPPVMPTGSGERLAVELTYVTTNNYLGSWWKQADAGSRVGPLEIVEYTLTLTTGTGKAYFPIGPELSGLNLLSCVLHLGAQAPTVQAVIVDMQRGRKPNTTTIYTYHTMFSTKPQVDATMWYSGDSATPFVIDTSYDDLLEGDMIRFDISQVGTVAGQGLYVTFRAG